MTRITIIYSVCALLFFSCASTDTDEPHESDHGSSDKPQFYGVWSLVSTSGGFTGKGYGNDFDLLLLKSDEVFEVYREGIPIQRGTFQITQDGDQWLVRFNCSLTSDIELCNDNEKYIVLEGRESLTLNGRCCDRFNQHLKRLR